MKAPATMISPKISPCRQPPRSSLPHPGRGSALMQSLKFWSSGMNGLSTTVAGGSGDGLGGSAAAAAGAPASTTTASTTASARITARFYQPPLRSVP